MPLLSESMDQWLYQYFDSHPEEMAEHSSAFVQYYFQVMAQRALAQRLPCDEGTRNCSSGGPPGEIVAMEDLYEKYLTLDRVFPYTQEYDFLRPSEGHLYRTRKLADLLGYLKETPHIILLSNVNPRYAIFMTPLVLAAITDKDEEAFNQNNGMIWFFEDQNNISTAGMDLRETFKDYFPLLRWTDGGNVLIDTDLNLELDPEAHPEIRSELASVLNVRPIANELAPILNVRPIVKATALKVQAPYSSLKNLLGEVLAMNSLDTELRGLFNKATKSRAYNKKFVSTEAQQELITAFAPCIYISTASSKPELKKPHYQQIMAKISSCCNSNREKATALICLSAIFVKYSSSAIFGTEYDSPTLLRNYAYALLQKAKDLEPDFLKDNISDWEDRLRGLAFSCTSILFGMMNGKLQRPETMKIAKQIIPPAWFY